MLCSFLSCMITFLERYAPYKPLCTHYNNYNNNIVSHILQIIHFTELLVKKIIRIFCFIKFVKSWLSYHIKSYFSIHHLSTVYNYLCIYISMCINSSIYLSNYIFSIPLLWMIHPCFYKNKIDQKKKELLHKKMLTYKISAYSTYKHTSFG